VPASGRSAAREGLQGIRQTTMAAISRVKCFDLFFEKIINRLSCFLLVIPGLTRYPVILSSLNP
jgi:hypothetical protein